MYRRNPVLSLTQALPHLNPLFPGNPFPKFSYLLSGNLNSFSSPSSLSTPPLFLTNA
jgi:hypothetical protein